MSLSRAFRVAALDLRHNLKRPLFWVFLAILGLSLWGLSSGQMRIASGDSMVGGTKAWITSEFAVAQTLTFLVFLFYAFFIAVVAGMSVIHDDNLKVGSVLHATPLRPSEYVLGKLGAVLVSFLGILGIHLLLAMFFNHVPPSAIAEEIRGPFDPANYLRPALVFAVPTIWFLVTTAFAAGVWTRSPILIFVLPVALVMGSVFFLWEWSPTWLDPAVNRLLMTLDVAGFRWMNETHLQVDQGVQFYNTARVPLDATLLLNRLLVLAAGFLAAGAALWGYARGLRGERISRRARKEAAASETGRTQAEAGTVPSIVGALGVAGRPLGLLAGAATVARAELRELRRQPGLYLFAPLILLQAIGSAVVDTGPFDAPVLATAGTLAVSMMNTLTLLVSLLLLFYTVESLEREKRHGLASIYNATPISTASVLLGKSLALAAIPIVLLLAAAAGSLAVIAFQGQAPLDPGPFLLVWGGLLLPTFLVWTAFVLAVHSITGNRYTTFALALGALIFTGWRQMTGQMNWVGNWDLWGVLQWSDMGTFELGSEALLWNRGFVIGLVVLFLALTLRFYPRAERDAARMGQRFRPGSIFKTALRLTPYAVVPLAAGIFLYFQVQAGFQGSATEKSLKDYWRRNLATWRDAKTPDLVDVDLRLELDPPRRWLRSEGTYALVNRETAPLAQFPLTRGLHWENVKWSLNGEAVEPEDRLGLMVFALDPPLATGDTIRVGFEFDGRYPHGVTKNGGGAPEFVLPSGVVLTSFRPSFAPLVGYDEKIGIDEDNRYESREYPDDFHEGVTRPLFGTGDRLTTRIRITGPEEYRYNSVGTLVEEEVADGRRTVLWVSDHPVNFFNVVAGRWAERRGERTAVYHHPGHDYNIDEISEALEASRTHYSNWFHPFPWRELKLSEFPALASYAQGFPTNITFSEGIGFLTRSDPRSDLAFMVTAHEAAHQWWGNLLLPGEGPGANVLSEGMAHFSTILLFEEVKGQRERIEFCKRIEERYGDRRQVDSERPLVKIDGSKRGDQTVTYDKGGWVFWMLLNHMGRARALAGIQEFIRTYGPGPDHPVLQDFLVVLRRHAADPEAFDAFAAQWFFDVVVPRYRFAEPEMTALGDGTWEVRVDVTNAGTGTMPVEVAAAHGERFSEEEGIPDEASPDVALAEAEVRGPETPVYRDARTTVTLGAGERRTVTIRCPFEPSRLLVDPDALVLQLGREAARVEL